MLKSAFENLLRWAESIIPGLFTITAVVGALIALALIVKHFYKKREGRTSGVVSGFPWVGLVFALLLIVPQVFLPVIGTILDVIFQVVIRVTEWFARTFGG